MPTLGNIDPNLLMGSRGIDAGENAAAGRQARQQAQGADAAQQFERMLLQQLWKAMRSTVSARAFGGGGAGGGTYLHFLDEAVAGQLVTAGGMGLAAELRSSMGIAEPELPGLGVDGVRGLDGQGLGEGHDLGGRVSRAEPLEISPRTGQRVSGATGRLQTAARSLLHPEQALRWGRDGRLTREDLSSDFRTDLGSRGTAAFNVRDAAGFQGRYKCNLFAFELVRRAGFQTPLMARSHGWGYPHPDSVTADAANGRLRNDWGRVVTGESAAELDAGATSGERGFLLSGSGRNGHAGHMAVVERVHSVDYDDEGRVRRIVFDGWEARSSGARHLSRRTWNRAGNVGGNDARNGLGEIEIIELLAPRSGRPEMPLSTLAGPSRLDAMPEEGGEE